MPITVGNKTFNTVGDYAESRGIPKERITPEWNIAYYEKLLASTKNSVKQKEIQQELDWWKESKELEEKLSNS